MRTLLMLVLGLVAFPVSAEELQFNVNGRVLPFGAAGSPTAPYNVTFMLNTLSCQPSSTFSSSLAGGCLTAWSVFRRAGHPLLRYRRLTECSLLGLEPSGRGLHEAAQVTLCDTERFTAKCRDFYLSGASADSIDEES
jgi:hypothetical protein